MWVPDLMVEGAYHVWWSPKMWYEIFNTAEYERHYVGRRFWEAA